jgi:hypothetical protein
MQRGTSMRNMARERTSNQRRARIIVGDNKR